MFSGSNGDPFASNYVYYDPLNGYADIPYEENNLPSAITSDRTTSQVIYAATKDVYEIELKEHVCEDKKNFTTFKYLSYDLKVAPLVCYSYSTITDRDSLLNYILQKLDQPKYKNLLRPLLLEMRDQRTKLGSFCFGKPDLKKQCSVKDFYVAERSFHARIIKALSAHCENENEALKAEIKKCFNIHGTPITGIDWAQVLQLVRNGANPNVTVSVVWKIELFNFISFRRYIENDNQPTVEQIEELLSFGFSPPATIFFFETLSGCDEITLKYICLFLRYGFGDVLGVSLGYYSSEEFLGNALDYMAKIVCADKRILPRIGELLNYDLPIKDEANVIPAILEYLLQAKKEDITPNMQAYLKPRKLLLLEYIKAQKDKALPILKEIFENEHSAIRKIFFQGGASITKGNLKIVYDKYVRLKALAEKPVVNVSLDEQLKNILNAFPFDADAAMALVRQGASPRMKAADGLELMHQMCHVNSNNRYDQYVKELLNHKEGFPIVYYVYKSENNDCEDFYLRCIVKFLELGADPNLFDSLKLLDVIGMFQVRSRDKSLLEFRNPETLLGKVGRRHLLASQQSFSQADCDADKKVMTRVYSVEFANLNTYLAKLIGERLGHYPYMMNEDSFNIEKALELIRLGANPNVVFTNQGIYYFSISVRLKDVFRATINTPNRFPLKQLDELLSYGFDFSKAKKDLFVATPELYDYVVLIMKYGCQPKIAMPKGSEGMSVLDCVLRDTDFTKPNPKEVKLVLDLLNYGGKIETIKNSKIFLSLSVWLHIIPKEQLTKNIVEYLRIFKPIFNAILAKNLEKHKQFARAWAKLDDISAQQVIFFPGKVGNPQIPVSAVNPLLDEDVKLLEKESDIEEYRNSLL